MPIESFAKPPKPEQDVWSPEYWESLLRDQPPKPPKPQSIRDWPRIHTAIRRDGLFVIETETPSFTAMLRFDPDSPDAGDYEVHYRPQGGAERGRTRKIISVPAGDTDYRVSMLAPFPTRYVVVTGGLVGSHPCLVWLVGLRDFRSVHATREAHEPMA
jgi:hypothetical protein